MPAFGKGSNKAELNLWLFLCSPFGALTSVDVLTCPSGAKSRYGRHRCIEDDDCCSKYGVTPGRHH